MFSVFKSTVTVPYPSLLQVAVKGVFPVIAVYIYPNEFVEVLMLIVFVESNTNTFILLWSLKLPDNRQ